MRVIQASYRGDSTSALNTKFDLSAVCIRQNIVRLSSASASPAAPASRIRTPLSSSPVRNPVRSAFVTKIVRRNDATAPRHSSAAVDSGGCVWRYVSVKHSRNPFAPTTSRQLRGICVAPTSSLDSSVNDDTKLYVNAVYSIRSAATRSPGTVASTLPPRHPCTAATPDLTISRSTLSRKLLDTFEWCRSEIFTFR